MSLSDVEKKTITVKRGFKYTYLVAAARESKPTLILFHGWADYSGLWHGLIHSHLIPAGYGIIAPDNLGYGESSKPLDVNAYAYNLLAADVVEILDAEHVQSVISLGHDWGSTICQRIYNYYPDRVIGLVTVNVAYMPPNGTFDLDKANEMTQSMFGKPVYPYWHYFNSDEGRKAMDKNVESVYCVEFGHPETWLDNFCTPGGMEAFIVGKKTQPTLPFADAQHKEDFMKRWSDGDGFGASLNWYKALSLDVQNKADALINEDTKVVKIPVLYWGGKQDYVCRPQLLPLVVEQGYLPNLKTVIREGGHYALLERPQEFGEDITTWLDETFR
jgi:soluble epoxide hydrolase/lipid-phosphate phosphatase